MKSIKLKFTKLHEEAVLPRYAHGSDEDAGMDLVAVADETISLGEVKAIRTGLAVELPKGYEAQVRSRSGLALKHGLFVLNAPGTIDPSYRGELCVIIAKFADPEPYQIRKGDRIAQLVIANYVQCDPVESKRLAGTKRGTGGLGSTGK